YIQIPLAGILIYAAEFFNTDYGWLGVLLIFIFYLLHEWRTPQVFFGIFPLFNELPAVLVGYLLLLLYNGKRGRFPKYLGYAIYPVHLLLFYLLSVCLHNGI
ncbi:MAG: TraX family protein, partial [Eubacteriales bacterium]